MAEKKRILITGHLGFIGSVVARNLRMIGYDIWGIDRSADNSDRSLAADLLDPRQTNEVMANIPDFQVLIHTAALAHGEKPLAGHSIYDVNVTMTKNIMASLGKRLPHIIFLSSVAVYGEDKQSQPVVCANATLRPATAYGHGKLESEKIILSSHLLKCDILRMAPVYDEQHLQDVGKRVYFPGMQGIKMRLSPPPFYSLCHVGRVVSKIQECILDGNSGRRIIHVADPAPYNQHQILGWFKGITIPFPVFFARPMYLLGTIIPGAKGYAIRCLFSKLFLSNVYKV
jgi:nucleoside-diphosphate-sugar epimerase